MERTGLVFSRKLHKIFVQKIHAQRNAIFVKRESNRITVWEITHESLIYRVVYDCLRKNIVTVLRWPKVAKLRPKRPAPIAGGIPGPARLEAAGESCL